MINWINTPSIQSREPLNFWKHQKLPGLTNFTQGTGHIHQDVLDQALTWASLFSYIYVNLIEGTPKLKLILTSSTKRLVLTSHLDL